MSSSKFSAGMNISGSGCYQLKERQFLVRIQLLNLIDLVRNGCAVHSSCLWDGRQVFCVMGQLQYSCVSQRSWCQMTGQFSRSVSASGAISRFEVRRVLFFMSVLKVFLSVRAGLQDEVIVSFDRCIWTGAGLQNESFSVCWGILGSVN